MSDGTTRRFARAELSRPGILVVYLLAPVASVAIWALGRAHLVHRWPYLVVIGSIAASVVVAALAAIPWLFDRTSTWKLHLKIAAQAAAVSAVIYMTGWGPMLVIVYMIVAHENLNLAGSSAWKSTIFWCTAGLVAGQLAIQWGVAPTLVSVPRSWAVAALAELALFTTVRQLSLLAADKEQAERAVLNHEKKWRDQALHDQLTGLPNRVFMQRAGTKVLEMARAESTRCGLLFMDLDKFKEVNDTYGHHYGDELLCEVAGRVERAVREPDTVARLGGDEFAVVLPEIPDVDTAVQVSRRILAAVSTPFRVMDVTVEVGISIGIALFPGNGGSLTELMMKADAAMYEAKRDGCGYTIAT